MDACRAWLTAVTGSSEASRGRSRACSTAVATRPAATRTGNGSGGSCPDHPLSPSARQPGSGLAVAGAPAAARTLDACPLLRSRPAAAIRPPSASCWPSPAATAPASTAPSRPSSRRSSSTARPSTCASRSCTTCTSSRRSRSAARSSSTRPTRCPRARSSCSPRTASRPAVREEARDAAAAHDRRHLPAGHQGAPGGQAVRPRGLRHPADRPRGPRGGRGHRPARRPTHIQLVETAADAATVTVRDPEKVVWLSQTTLSVDETMETVGALRERFPHAAEPAERRHLLRHAEPAGRGQGDGAAVRPGARRRLARTRRTRCGSSRSR